MHGVGGRQEVGLYYIQITGSELSKKCGGVKLEMEQSQIQSGGGGIRVIAFYLCIDAV